VFVADLRIVLFPEQFSDRRDFPIDEEFAAGFRFRRDPIDFREV
jgi:hypothetical protein